MLRAAAALACNGNDIEVILCVVKVAALRVRALGVAQAAVSRAARAAAERSDVRINVCDGAQARADKCDSRRTGVTVQHPADG